MDTGASHHMSCEKYLFTHINTTPQSVYIVLPNGQIIEAIQIGVVPLTPDIVLLNVLFVPVFNYNLILVSKLTHDHCIFQVQYQVKTLATGAEKDGQYYFSQHSQAEHSFDAFS